MKTNEKIKLVIGSDHAGFSLKKKIIQHIQEKGYEVEDLGTNSQDSADYPDYAHPVASKIEKKNADFGILICGSANGVNMVANKHENVRAAIAWNAEIARLGRQHNNANVLSLPARYITEEQAMEIVDSFLGTEFEGGRHERRVSKINISHNEP